MVMPPPGVLQLFAAFSQSRIEKLIWLPPVAGAAVVVVTVKYVRTPLFTAMGVSVSWYGVLSSDGHGVDPM